MDTFKPRRSIYTKVMRNTRDPLLDVFDAPQHFSSTAQRDATTTPVQSLLLINSPNATLPREPSRAPAQERLPDEAEQIPDAYRLAFDREPRRPSSAGRPRLARAAGRVDCEKASSAAPIRR